MFSIQPRPLLSPSHLLKIFSLPDPTLFQFQLVSVILDESSLLRNFCLDSGSHCSASADIHPIGIDLVFMGPYETEVSTSCSLCPFNTSRIKENITRRSEIAKVVQRPASWSLRLTIQVARNLQDWLMFANYKLHNGLEHRTLESIEAEMTETLKRQSCSFDYNPSTRSLQNYPIIHSKLPRSREATFNTRGQGYITRRRRIRTTSGNGPEFKSVREQKRPDTCTLLQRTVRTRTLYHLISFGKRRIIHHTLLNQTLPTTERRRCHGEIFRLFDRSTVPQGSLV